MLHLVLESKKLSSAAVCNNSLVVFQMVVEDGSGRQEVSNKAQKTLMIGNSLTL